jgi:CNT family concentrative nucleoside transporter
MGYGDKSDEEKNVTSSSSVQESNRVEQTEAQSQSTSTLAKYSLYIQLGGWLLFTGWWIAGLILHHQDKNWIFPFLLWLSITLRVLSLHVTIPGVWKFVRWTWNHTVRIVFHIPSRFRLPAAAFLVIAVILTGAFTINESKENTRKDRAISLLGFVTFIVLVWATSRNRRKVNWQTVIVGILVQFVVALFVLRTTAGYDIFHFISTLAGDLLGFASGGVGFLTDTSVTKLGWFLIAVVPPIIFFIALIQILYHYKFIPWFIGKFAVFFWWSMGVSGAEAVAAAASPFIGQGENAVLIKPFILHLTNAEIHQVVSHPRQSRNAAKTM